MVSCHRCLFNKAEIKASLPQMQLVKASDFFYVAWTLVFFLFLPQFLIEFYLGPASQ